MGDTNWMASEDGKRFVEECVTAIVVDGRAIEALTDHATGWAIYTEQLEAKEIDLPAFENNLFESEKRTVAEFIRVIFPFLDQAMREKYAAQLAVERDKLSGYHNLTRRTGFGLAAAFLRRERAL